MAGPGLRTHRIHHLTLHVTNGDIAAELIRATGIGGTVLPWRDVLHEGPLPGGLSLADLSEVRAHFLAQPGTAGSFEDTLRHFRTRDATLAAGFFPRAVPSLQRS